MVRQLSSSPFTRSAPHRTKADATKEAKNDQSKRDPNTSYSGMVEKRFVTVASASGLVGGGGNDERIWTTVERR